MNPSFENTKNAFAYKTTAELKKARFLFGCVKYPLFAKLATKVIPTLMNVNAPLVNGIMRNTIFRQFVGGETLEETSRVVKNLSAYQVQVILDYGIEAKEGEENFDAVTEKIIEAVEFAGTQQNIPFVSVKITGIASQSVLEHLNEAPRLRSGVHDSEYDSVAWQNVKERMFAICEAGKENGVGILIDAEESWIQDPIDRLAIELMSLFNKEKVIVYNTYQLYRHDRLHFLKMSHRLANEGKFLLGAKLVRGAYMEKERARAITNNYASPIHENKEGTDADFNAAAAYCLENKAAIALLLASHNELSAQLAIDKMNALQIDKKDTHVHFSQLFGMSDHITFNLALEGYNASKYLPFGPLKEVVPYLMRRAEENTSVNGQTSRELLLIRKELSRRK